VTRGLRKQRRRLSDSLTALAARSFPAARASDALAVRDCARDAIDAGGLRVLTRECMSLVSAGLRVRAGLARRELRTAPWREALAVLTLPLASALLVVWVFGFVPRYDHWPLGEGWALLLSGSVAAVVGAALMSRWLTAAGAVVLFVAAASPYIGWASPPALSHPSFFDGGAGAVDFGATSLVPALLLFAGALSLPRARLRSARLIAGRLALGLGPGIVALVVLLPAPTPEPTYGAYAVPGVGNTVVPGPTFEGPPYPFPYIWHADTLIQVLGVVLAIALVVTWREVRAKPANAVACGLVLASISYAVAWLVFRELVPFGLWVYDAWWTGVLTLLPLTLALLLVRRGGRQDWPTPPASPAARSPSRT
jgi:hypothetical protein